MERSRLQSSTLAFASYHRRRRQLELEFRSGKRYLYFRVPAQIYEELLQAPSKGVFFNRNIRNRFPFQELSAPSAPIVLTAASKTK
jgi:hypothetical protein